MLEIVVFFFIGLMLTTALHWFYCYATARLFAFFVEFVLIALGETVLYMVAIPLRMAIREQQTWVFSPVK